MRRKTMEGREIRVLLVDDDEDDYVITRDLLSEINEMDCNLEWVGTYGAAVGAISRACHDVYLVDYGLGERNGLELLREVREAGCGAPIILLTGQGDHEIDLEAMKAGASDYLVKGQISAPLLERSVRYAIERAQTLEALRNSEDQYKRLFRSNPIPMWVYDRESLRFMAVNDAAVRNYGYAKDEFLGMSLTAILAGENLVNAGEASPDLPEFGMIETRTHLKKDGTQMLVEVTSHQISFAGKAARLVMANDITERKRMETALKESEEHFRSLTENALDLISVVDLGGKILYQSPSVGRALGYQPDEIIGSNLIDIIHLEDRYSVSEFLSRIAACPGISCSAEFRVQHSEGSYRVLEAIGSMPLENSGIGGIVVNSRDVTERKHLQEQLIQSEKLAALGKLISGVAHELNNPLTSVIGYTQLALSQHELDGELKDRLEIVRKQGERARRIVQNMLSFARQHKPSRSSVDLNSLLEATLELRAYELGVNNIDVRREFADVGLVIGDGHLLQQVFLNMVINAEQAMRETNKRGVLTVSTGEIEVAGRRGVRISIADDGPGIPPDIRGKIFDPFFTTKDVGEGTGLGLSISYGIIKEHGGEISLQSDPGAGTTFVIDLPCEPIPVEASSLSLV